MYHVSRQSFLYLKSFYIGELSSEDLSSLQMNARGDNTTSEGFLRSLRTYTEQWRVKIDDTVRDAVHLSL